jgi:hypothetical protein
MYQAIGRASTMQAAVTASAMVTVRNTTSTFAPWASATKLPKPISRTTWPVKSSSRKKLFASSASSDPTYTAPTHSSGGTSSSRMSSARRR